MEIESHTHKDMCRPSHSVHQVHVPMKEEGDKPLWSLGLVGKAVVLGIVIAAHV